MSDSGYSVSMPCQSPRYGEKKVFHIVVNWIKSRIRHTVLVRLYTNGSRIITNLRPNSFLPPFHRLEGDLRSLEIGRRQAMVKCRTEKHMFQVGVYLLIAFPSWCNGARFESARSPLHQCNKRLVDFVLLLKAFLMQGRI